MSRSFEDEGEVTRVANVGELQQELKRAGLAKRVVVAEATVDPWRDNPHRLQAYAKLAAMPDANIFSSEVDLGADGNVTMKIALPDSGSPAIPWSCPVRSPHPLPCARAQSAPVRVDRALDECARSQTSDRLRETSQPR